MSTERFSVQVRVPDDLVLAMNVEIARSGKYAQDAFNDALARTNLRLARKLKIKFLATSLAGSIINVRVEKSTYDEAKEYARKNNVSIRSYVYTAIVNYFSPKGENFENAS